MYFVVYGVPHIHEVDNTNNKQVHVGSRSASMHYLFHFSKKNNVPPSKCNDDY